MRKRLEAIVHDKSMRLVFAILAVAILGFGVPSPGNALAPPFAGSLTVGSASALAGNNVTLDISLSSGAGNVCTLQLDLLFSSALSYVSTSTGAASAAASKSASGSIVSGGVRMLVFNLNRNVIGAGSVASVTLAIAGGAPAGTIPVAITNITASDPDGNSLPLTGVDGSVTVLPAADVTPPVISNVASSGISNSGATISWQTNEASDSQVDFGTTSSYGSSTTLSTSMVTSHAQALSGLVAATTYHYRVKSKDAAGNPAASGDYTFMTSSTADTTPPIISSVASTAITNSGATITWTTNENADAQVEYGTTSSYGSSTALNTSLVTSHSQSLSVLLPSTTYHYRVKSKDAAGNLAASGDYTFTTTASGPTDTTPPIISGVTNASINSTSATVSWTTNEAADTQVEFGKTTSYGSSTALNSILSTSHAQGLTALLPATIYHYRVKSKDAAGNLAVSNDYTFTTTASGPTDTTPPIISGVTSSNVKKSDAIVSWTTNKAADSQVEYGTTTAYGTSTTKLSDLVTSHEQALSELMPGTLYHYRVKSSDAAGNLAVSGDYSFTTRPAVELVLYYPRMLTKDVGRAGSIDQEYTGIGVANLGNEIANLTFSVYNPNGTLISGAGVTNPVTRELQPGEQLPILDQQVFGTTVTGPDATGWVKIESDVASVSGFYMMYNGRLSELDGADMYSTPLTSFVFTEINTDGFTKINIGNPNAFAATLTFSLFQPGGSTAATATRTIPGNGALVADLYEDLFPNVMPDPWDYVRVTSTVGVLPYQVMGKLGTNGTPSTDLQSLHGQDISAGATRLYCPQYILGDLWNTTVSLVNLDAAPGSVSISFIGMNGAQIGPTRAMHIEPLGKLRIADTKFFEPSMPAGGREGYLQIMSSGIRLAGSVVFGDFVRQSHSTALPLVNSLDTSIVFSHVSSNDTYFTGVAIVNPNWTEAHVTVQLFNGDGSPGSSTAVTIPANRRISVVMTELFPELVGVQRYSGYFQLTSDIGIASFAVFGSHDFKLLSAIPPQPVR